MAKIKTVDPDVAAVLRGAKINRDRLTIQQQLDPGLYRRVNQVLRLAGGKWNMRAKAHVFPGSAKAALTPIMGKGKVVDKKQTFGVFPTPSHIIDMMLEHAGLLDNGPRKHVLEPSFGDGRIVDAVWELGHLVTCVEIRAEPVLEMRALQRAQVIVCRADFLKFVTSRARVSIDVVVMNPPFSRNADIDHVRHAYSLLREGGTLVAIMSSAAVGGVQKRQEAFAAFVAEKGKFFDLPDDTFKESGTRIRTVMVVLKK